MGTRGLYGFYYKGKFYVIYNHFDSYPSGLGCNIVNEIQNEMDKYGNLDRWIEMLKNIKVLSETTQPTQPTQQDIDKLAPYTDLSISNKSTFDWYCLLSKTQGSINKVFESGYLLNHVNDEQEPYFQEYAYIVNFDTNQLDFYYSDSKVASFSLSKLPQFV